MPTAQRRDHDVGEILADPVAQREGLAAGVLTSVALRIEGHVAVQRVIDGGDGFQHGHAGAQLLAGVGGDGRIGLDAGEGPVEVMRRARIEPRLSGNGGSSISSRGDRSSDTIGASLRILALTVNAR